MFGTFHLDPRINSIFSESGIHAGVKDPVSAFFFRLAQTVIFKFEVVPMIKFIAQGFANREPFLIERGTDSRHGRSHSFDREVEFVP
jgi:hypothetical protein